VRALRGLKNGGLLAKSNSDKRKIQTLVGLGFIAFGIIGAFIGYVSDFHSFDYLKISLAKDYAILHLVIWVVFGLFIILLANRLPDDELPFETRDDNRDGMR
jgi:hypothetical protein